MSGSLADEFPGVTPQLTVHDADAAARFYRVAFGADELLRNHGPDGRVMHCEMLINGGRLLLHDEFSGDSPRSLGGTPVTLHLYVSDVDAVYAAALAAGATAEMPPQDAFWGDRYALVLDPFGHRWSIATPREELSVADLEERGDTWSASRREEAGTPGDARPPEATRRSEAARPPEAARPRAEAGAGEATAPADATPSPNGRHA